MLHVKFSSKYTEIDRQGNTRIQENSFEATGSYHEVADFTFNLMERTELPGIRPLSLSGRVRSHLLENKF